MTPQTPKIANLTIDRMSLADLKPHPRNPRRHPAPGSPAWNTLRRSLQNAYWDPIIWNRRNGCMVGGHLRQRILLEDGYTQADVSVVDLDEDTHYAVMIAANKAIGDDDEQAVKDLLNELASGGFDMSLTGYDDDELGDILAGPEQDQEAADKVVVDKAAELQAKWGTAEGQLWVMGSHRILCGSCTDPKNWARLMRGEKATLCNTDPPYGVSYVGTDKKWQMIKNDHKREDDLLATLLLPAMARMLENTDPDAAFYIWHASSTRRDFEKAMDMAGLEEKQCILWIKDSIVLGHADYHWQQEPAFYAQRSGTTCRWYGDRSQATVWRIKPPSPADMSVSIANGVRLSDGAGNAVYISTKAPKARKTRLIRVDPGESITVIPEHTTDAWEIARTPQAERLHPTQKPVGLFRIPIMNHTVPGELIIEPFAGGCGQFVAAHETGRRCYGMDLDPKYVAVGLERMSMLGIEPHQEANNG